MPFSYATLANTLRRSDADPIVSASNNDVEGIGFYANITERNNIPERLRTSEFLAVVGSDVYIFTGPSYTPTSNDDFMDPAVWTNTSNWTLVNPDADIDSLVGVNTSGVLDGQTLIYDDATDTWLPANIPTPNLEDLSDVTGSPVNGSHLRYNGTAWEFITAQALVSGASIQDLSDVNGSGSPALNDVLKWDGSKWDHLPESGGVSEIGALSDVTIPSAASRTSGSILTWDGSSAYEETDAADFRRATKIEDLNGFDFAGTPGNGDTIVWDGSEWTFAANATGTGGSTTLSGLSDTSVSSPALGNFLIYNGSAWANVSTADVATTLEGNMDLSDLSDVAAATNGQILRFNGTTWDAVDANDHTHPIADVTGLQTALNGKADTGHTHAIADVVNLQTTLDGKQPAGSYSLTSHNHALESLSNVVTTGLNVGDLISWNGSDWVPWDPSNKADTVHSHAIADVTGLQTALDGKQPAGSYASASHTHDLDDLTDVSVSSSTTSQFLQKQADGSWQGTTLSTNLWDTAATNATAALTTALSNTSDIADLRTTTGTADGDTTMGTYTAANHLSDNVSTKANLIELDAALAEKSPRISTQTDTTSWGTTNQQLFDNLSQADVLYWDGSGYKKADLWSVWVSMAQFIATEAGTNNPDLYDTQLGSIANPADVDGDGTVTVNDLLSVLAGFGDGAYEWTNSLWYIGGQNITSATDHFDEPGCHNPSHHMLADSGYTPGTWKTFDLDFNDTGSYTGGYPDTLDRQTGSASTIIDPNDLWVGFQDNGLGAAMSNFSNNTQLRANLIWGGDAARIKTVGPDSIILRVTATGHDAAGNLLTFANGQDYQYEWQLERTVTMASHLNMNGGTGFNYQDLEPNNDLHQLRFKAESFSLNGNCSHITINIVTSISRYV